MLVAPQFIQEPEEETEADILLSIHHKVNECMEIASHFFGRHFRCPSCNLQQRGRAAGTAHLHKNQIRFNLFMYKQDRALFLSTVVPHEIAHVIVFQIYGDRVKPHGKEWQAVMKKVFHLSPSRTHSFDVPPPRQAFIYHCGCQQHIFSRQRHSRAERGTEYVCKLCRKTLQFTAKHPC